MLYFKFNLGYVAKERWPVLRNGLFISVNAATFLTSSSPLNLEIFIFFSPF